MSNEKFKVKFGLAVGDTSATIDAATGNIVTAGNAAVNGGQLTTTSATALVFNTNATTVNAFGDATTLNIGNVSGTTTVNGDLTVGVDLDVKGGDITNSTGALQITTASNGDLTLDPDGTGQVIINAALDVNGSITADLLQIDNIQIDGNDIISTNTNGNINIVPNGTGDIYLTTDITYIGDANTTAYISTNGTGDLVLNTNANVNSGSFTIVNGANGNIALAPNGTGIVTVSTALTAAKSVGSGNATLATDGSLYTYQTLDATGGLGASVPVLGFEAENVTTGYSAGLSVVDHGQNRSGGTATTTGNPMVTLTSTRGTAASPTATGAGDLLGTIALAGYDGARSLGQAVNGGSVQLVALAGQAFVNNGTYTTQAGAVALLRAQPNNLRFTSNSRQNLFQASYVGGTTNTPPTQTLQFNSGSMTTQYDIAGNAINGHGRQDVIWYHPTHNIYGVPSQSTANADNSTLPGSNIINFFTSRQSGWSGRRDIVQSGDTLSSIRTYGQTTDNSTGTGSLTGGMDFTAAELFSTTRRGSRFTLSTGEIGTNTFSARLTLDSDNFNVSTTKTTFKAAASYGGEISQKVGILGGATTYDKSTELSVTANTLDGSNNATYETKTQRYDGTNYSPTQNNDVLGRFTFLGNYASGTSPAVSNAAGNVTVSASENWTSGASGAMMQFNVNKTGTNTSISVLDLSATSSIFRSDAFTFQDSSNVNITGNKITYNRVYGQWQNLNLITPAASNTAYAFALPTTDFSNIATVNTTSHIVPGAAGMYKLQFSVQVRNDDSAAEHIAYFWWRKNGTDVPNSMGQVGVSKATGAGDALTIAGWDNMIQSTSATDYWELMYAVDDANHVDFPFFATTAFGPATASLFVTLVPIGA